MAIPMQPLHLDWKAYFHEFKMRHGVPVPYEGQLLFPDGWQYSATDYKGPEWQPPTDPDELRQLQVTYQEIRKKALEGSHWEMREEMGQLYQIAHQRSAPLQQRVKTEWGYKVVPLDLEERRARMQEVEDAIKECRTRIAELQGSAAGDPVPAEGSPAVDMDPVPVDPFAIAPGESKLQHAQRLTALAEEAKRKAREVLVDPDSAPATKD